MVILLLCISIYWAELAGKFQKLSAEAIYALGNALNVRSTSLNIVKVSWKIQELRALL